MAKQKLFYIQLNDTEARRRAKCALNIDQNKTLTPDEELKVKHMVKVINKELYELNDPPSEIRVNEYTQAYYNWKTEFEAMVAVFVNHFIYEYENYKNKMSVLEYVGNIGHTYITKKPGRKHIFANFARNLDDDHKYYLEYHLRNDLLVGLIEEYCPDFYTSEIELRNKVLALPKLFHEEMTEEQIQYNMRFQGLREIMAAKKKEYRKRSKSIQKETVIDKEQLHKAIEKGFAHLFDKK